MRRLRIAVLIGLSLSAVVPGPGGAQELTLSVAISMKEPIAELTERFRAERAGVVLHTNLGGSGALQKQIEAGAPVDLFVSAGQTQMDALERQGLIVPASRRVFARNLLTVVVPVASRVGLARPADLLSGGVTRIAIGNPGTVPAGQYAQASLRSQGLWEALRGRLVLAENVRQVLEYVARGEVEAGFVYATDAATRPAEVREAFRPARESYPAILYPAAAVKGSRRLELATAFLDLLAGPRGQAALARRGFLPPSGGLR